MIRTWAKSQTAPFMSWSGVHRFLGQITRGGAIPPVIGYHRVVEHFSGCAESFIPSLLISAATLEKHLDWLGRRYRFVDLNEIVSCIERGETGRSVALTFDDGYRDFYELAYPLLQRKGIPCALFVVSSFPDTDMPQTHDLLYRGFCRTRVLPPDLSYTFGLPDLSGLDPFGATRACIEALPVSQLRSLAEALNSDSGGALRDSISVSWDQIARMHRAGVIIGSHTRTHALLPNEDESTLRFETSGSRRDIQEKLQSAVDYFAYPSGAFDDVSVRAVAAAGYRCAFGTCRHRDAAFPMLSIPRTLLWERSCSDSDGRFSGPVLECLIEGAFDAISGCRRNHRRGHAALPHHRSGAAA